MDTPLRSSKGGKHIGRGRCLKAALSLALLQHDILQDPQFGTSYQMDLFLKGKGKNKPGNKKLTSAGLNLKVTGRPMTGNLERVPGMWPSPGSNFSPSNVMGSLLRRRIIEFLSLLR